VPIKPSKKIDTIPNPYPGREYEIDIESPEFTCLCPITGQPDFALVTIHYVPGPRCLELKGLKSYLWSFRNEGAFHEDVTNRILDELVKAVEPRDMTVTCRFNVRGGIFTTVRASHPPAEEGNKKRRP